ncbi:hypothetical protein [Kangiella sp. M94]
MRILVYLLSVLLVSCSDYDAFAYLSPESSTIQYNQTNQYELILKSEENISIKIPNRLSDFVFPISDHDTCSRPFISPKLDQVSYREVVISPQQPYKIKVNIEYTTTKEHKPILILDEDIVICINNTEQVEFKLALNPLLSFYDYHFTSLNEGYTSNEISINLQRLGKF